MGLRDLAIVVCSENIRFKVILLSPAAQRTVRKSKQVQPHDFFKISAYWTQIKLESSSTWDKSCTGKITNFFFLTERISGFVLYRTALFHYYVTNWVTLALFELQLRLNQGPQWWLKREKSVFQSISHLYWDGFSSDVVSIKE